jgi:hypothetical protein
LRKDILSIGPLCLRDSPSYRLANCRGLRQAIRNLPVGPTFEVYRRGRRSALEAAHCH